MQRGTAEQQGGRGVFVARGVGGAFEVTVQVRGGTPVMQVVIDPRFYDEAFVQRLRRWLDRVDPQLRIVSGDAAVSG